MIAQFATKLRVNTVNSTCCESRARDLHPHVQMSPDIREMVCTFLLIGD